MTGEGVEKVLEVISSTAEGVGVGVTGTLMVMTVGEYPLGQKPESPRMMSGLAETVAAPPNRAKPIEATV